MKKVLVLLLFSILILSSCTVQEADVPQQGETLEWFIPDGMRADPYLFNIYEWAENGELPNIKRMMEMGSYGYSIPTFPSHTPTNFATLLTGSYPEVHGVADGPMHVEGYSLQKPSLAGFSSSSRNIPAAWSLFEDEGKNVVLLSVPGSTPPELEKGTTIRGRWGGWGADFHSLIFETYSKEQRQTLARGSRLFFLGYELTRFITPDTASDWILNQPYSGQPLDLTLDIHGQTVYAKVIDTTKDFIVNYDTVVFSLDEKTVVAQLKQGEWSDWIPATFIWNDQQVSSNVKFQVIKLDADGFFRIRAVVDNLNEFITQPPEASDELKEAIGPMVDFVDNFPPQLIYYPEDKQTFIDEADMSLQWHRDAVDAVHEQFAPDIFIHDIYTPNQMLTSRWWLGYIDNASTRYDEVSPEEREELWAQVKAMYKELDAIIGESLDHMDENTVLVLSSDHGATPLNMWVRLNNVFAQHGWLSYSFDEETGEQIIDWERSQVAYLKMDNIYVNPDGLGPEWTRGSGEEYEALRDEVIDVLNNLTSPSGEKVVVAAVKWEKVTSFLDLPPSRVGDIVVANAPGYGWNEELTQDGAIFEVPLKTGYKQAILANDTPAMWTPFIIVGPGVKKGYQIPEPIHHVDQLPTILSIMNSSIPSTVQGRVLDEIIE
ncbi:MAG: alkaline phosphatase family protein [Nanoarchaeota archaeon]|nr:alkaline phosphatase family protein [Nanoarchaeota archaeon]